MPSYFTSAMQKLFSGPATLLDAEALFDPGQAGAPSIASAFLLALGGHEQAGAFLRAEAAKNEPAAFFLETLDRVEKEMEQAVELTAFVQRLKALAENPADDTCLREVFFPEGAGLPGTRAERVQALRDKRKVKITELNPEPLTDPGCELLFTSNVLLTVPAANTSLDDLDYNDTLKEHIRQAMSEEQRFWFDHPIQVGVAPEANEILYGLRGLDEAVGFERTRGNMGDGKIACALSTSVTHLGLRGLARDYIESEIRNAGGFRHIDVYVFTEADTDRLIKEVLVPAGGDGEMLDVFGVDGEYGRHYSFLKAIAGLWNVCKDPLVKATFKIDLDQVFPQKELVEQSGGSAFDHFKTPLWGARGTDAEGHPVNLGMIAGALVNEKDIHRGLFTPDVLFPGEPSIPEERVFFSKMLMALSTEGELMTRYGKEGIDGVNECIQRIHVTGGTNGIRVDSLKKHRPFTPSFIGRAEDQSYLLSVLMGEGETLGYLHEDGLIMRHDKEAFAGDAIKAASFGNIVGDYIRTLYFSGYARVLTNGKIGAVKEVVDPFTGCFITPTPVTVVMLRFCLCAAEFFLAGEQETGTAFVEKGSPRLARAMRFVEEGLAGQYRREREGWNQFYDLLDELGKHAELRTRAKEIIDGCRVRT